MDIDLDDDVLDINLIECWVNAFEDSVLSALEESVDFNFECAYDDDNGGLLPLPVVKGKDEKKYSSWTRKIFGR